MLAKSKIGQSHSSLQVGFDLTANDSFQTQIIVSRHKTGFFERKIQFLSGNL